MRQHGGHCCWNHFGGAVQVKQGIRGILWKQNYRVRFKVIHLLCIYHSNKSLAGDWQENEIH